MMDTTELVKIAERYLSNNYDNLIDSIIEIYKEEECLSLMQLTILRQYCAKCNWEAQKAKEAERNKKYRNKKETTK